MVKIYNKLKAFSLAETMVVLVIVAIIMAAAAPLVVKKMSGGNNRLIIDDGNNVFVAAGNSQSLHIGRSASDNTKLVVNGNTNLNGNLTITNRDISGTAQTIKLAADGIKSSDDNTIFNVTYDGATRTATTNIEIAIPDYAKISDACNNCKAERDGYIYATNLVDDNNFSVGTACDAIVNTPTGESNTTVNLTITTTTNASGNQTIESFPMLIPVSAGTCWACGNNCYFIPLKTADTIVETP